MFKLFICASLLATQILLADVIVTDRPNKRFLVLWKDTTTTIRIKACISIPDEGRPRECLEKGPQLTGYFAGYNKVKNFLSAGLKTESLAEATQALERNQSQRNAKRVIDIDALENERRTYEEAQSSLLTFQRFSNALENEDFEIDLEKGPRIEQDLASLIIKHFDKEQKPKYKTSHGPARDARYFSGWIEGQGAMARYSGFYSFNLWNRADFGGPVVHREDAQGRLTRNAVMDTTGTWGVFKDTGGSEKHGLIIRGNRAVISIDGVYHGTIYEEDLGERITFRK